MSVPTRSSHAPKHELLTRTYNVPRAFATYLNYPLTITEAHVLVYSPDGRLLGRRRSLASARRLVRAQRRVVA